MSNKRYFENGLEKGLFPELCRKSYIVRRYIKSGSTLFPGVKVVKNNF
jgi:hypothetical protein